MMNPHHGQTMCRQPAESKSLALPLSTLPVPLTTLTPLFCCWCREPGGLSAPSQPASSLLAAWYVATGRPQLLTKLHTNDESPVSPCGRLPAESGLALPHPQCLFPHHTTPLFCCWCHSNWWPTSRAPSQPASSLRAAWCVSRGSGPSCSPSCSRPPCRPQVQPHCSRSP